MNKSYIELVDYLNDQINKSLITDEKIIKIINDINDFNSKTKNQQYYIRNKERFKKYYEENKEKIKEKSIILFDDIYTTGATANECSKVLKENGAKEVLIFTIAKD